MRVKAVINSSRGVPIIKVHLEDIVPGDVLYGTGSERDSIIETILRRDIHGYPQVQLIYKKNSHSKVPFSIWMRTDTQDRCCIFVHDLHRERFEFLEQQEEINA